MPRAAGSRAVYPLMSVPSTGPPPRLARRPRVTPVRNPALGAAPIQSSHRATTCAPEPPREGRPMETTATAKRKKRNLAAAPAAADALPATFSSDLLTPAEERELLTHFWDCKSELG